MNLHKVYYKEYYNKIDFGVLLPNTVNDGTPSTDELKAQKIANEKNIDGIKCMNTSVLMAGGGCCELPFKVETLEMEVLYPGLVTGIGITHDVGITGEFKLGVNFDYTYGIPIISGSTVKCALRSHLRVFEGDASLIKYGISSMNFKKNINSIFGDDDEDSNGKVSIYDRDIFFDAVIVKPSPCGKYLCSDSITPHGDNPLMNPNPITFMKIAPGATIEFRFKLTETKEPKIDKLGLFKFLLSELGIGAKTNVGYGQLKIIEPKIEERK